MGIQAEKRGKFALKTFGNYLYTWSPESPTYKKEKSNVDKKYFCNATPGSQGEDWICTYVYDLSVLNGVQQRIAYVACDYVK